MKQSAQTFISRLLLIVAYSAFFIVQVYFNVGSVHSYRSGHCSYHVSKTNKHVVRSINPAQSPAKDKVNVLVNKKFQPENTLSLTYTLEAPQPVYLSKPGAAIPVVHLYIASILTKSLRAPPTA